MSKEIREQIDKFKNWNKSLNEGLFNKKTKLEKINDYFIKLEKVYEKLVNEAGSEDNLSRGIELNYDNFGKFSELSYNIIDIIKNELEENTEANLSEYKNVLLKLKEKTDKINHIKGVSEISVEEFKFVKRNVDKILNWIG